MGCSSSTSAVVPEVGALKKNVPELKIARVVKATAVIIAAGFSKGVLTAGLLPAYVIINPFTAIFIALTVVGLPILLGCKLYVENYTELYAGLVKWEAKELENLGFKYPPVDDFDCYGPDP